MCKNMSLNPFDNQNCFALQAHVASDLVKDTTTCQTPFLTIAIPTYKRPALLKDALSSALNQEQFDDYEVIVVDNDQTAGSETEKMLCGPAFTKFRYYKNRANIGCTGNWNRCVELARGKWVALLHDDDVYFPNFVHDLCAAIQNNPKIEFIHARQVQWEGEPSENINSLFTKYGSAKRIRPRKVSTTEDFFCSPIGATGCVFKKENAIKIGGFKLADDWPNADAVFYSFYNYHYNCYFLNKYLGVYRWGNNATLNMDLIVKLATCNFAYKMEYGKLLNLPDLLVNFEAKYSTIFYANNLKLVHKLYPVGVRSLLSHYSFCLFGVHCLLKLFKKKLFR